MTASAMGKSSLKQKASSQSAQPSEQARAAEMAGNQSIGTLDIDQSPSNPGIIEDCDAAVKDFERGSR